VYRRNSNNLEAFAGKLGVTPAIPRRPVTHVVRDAVDFDDQANLVAVEVENVIAGIVLLTKLQSIRAGLEALPQEHLREAHLPAQPFRPRLRFDRALQHSDPPLKGEVAALRADGGV